MYWPHLGIDIQFAIVARETLNPLFELATNTNWRSTVRAHDLTFDLPLTKPYIRHQNL